MQQYSTDPSWTRFSFSEMMQNYFDQTKYRYDIEAQMSFMSKNMPNDADDEFWSFNDRISCKAKVDYVYQNDLGGTMIWELKGSYIPSNPSGNKNPQLNYINEAHCLNNSSIQSCSGSSGDLGAVGDKSIWKIIDDMGNPSDGPGYNSVVNGITVPHNQPSQLNMGSVNFTYSYTDRFITISEYLVFLNDIDPANTLNFEGDLVNKGFIQYSGGNWIANTSNSCSSGQNISAVDVEKLPVTWISYNQAARFTNWAATRDPDFGAYTFGSNDGNANITAINPSWDGVRLPTENEFYKAAYWDKENQTYNLFGTTSLDDNDIPFTAIANYEGVIYPSEGHLYNMSSNTQGGSPCYWQSIVGQGGYSAFGIYNMVGGFQHFLTTDNPSFPITSIILRPDKQDTGGESGQRSSAEFSFSASQFCGSCSFSLVMQDNVCELNCSLTNSGIDNIHCNDNGTTENSIDDFVEFTLNPSGIDVGAAYLVSASAGGIVTPSYGFYGNPTIFQLQSGSANGFTYTITIKDVRDASCYLTNTVSANPCSNQSISKCTGP
ncbi:MAG: SUMF1/EgtB/PvdO family nonheme iron enzyme, partial [Melioribacteraceae bacterium]